jgi:hypothetical protein
VTAQTTPPAPISPTTPAHPALPWALGISTPHGQLLRYVYVPPVPVTLQYVVFGPPLSPPPPPEPAPPAVEPPPASGSAPTVVPAASTAPPGAPPAGEATRDPRTTDEPAQPPESAAPTAMPAVPQVVSQQVVVPGYYVRETTVGFHYPERWIIEQTGANAYRWRQLPPQFVPK